VPVPDLLDVIAERDEAGLASLLGPKQRGWIEINRDRNALQFLSFCPKAGSLPAVVAHILSSRKT
jgi:hypothetical protein